MSSDEVELISLLGTRFIERKDVKAVAGEPHVEKGGPPLPWQPVKQPFTMQDFTDHLQGTRTFGHYMVNPVGNTCKLFAFDIDLRESKAERRNPKGELISEAFEGSYIGDDLCVYPCNPREDWGKVDHPARPYLTRQLLVCARLIAQVVDELGIDVAIALSGHKGIHVYGLTGSMEATVLKETAIRVMTKGDFTSYRGEVFFEHVAFQNLTVEIFPKQDSLDGKDLGNLMKLPLGVHKATGKRGQFITLADDTITLVDPVEALTSYKAW